MSRFLSELETRDITDKVVELISPLIYESDLLKCTITVPKDFQSDFASVPRMPIVYFFYGGRAHREAVIHDYLFRTDSVPIATRKQADDVFFEAMEVRGKSAFVKWGMWAGVRLGSWIAFHKMKVTDKL